MSSYTLDKSVLGGYIVQMVFLHLTSRKTGGSVQRVGGVCEHILCDFNIS